MLPLVENLNGSYGHDAMNCMILCVYRKGKTSFECYNQFGLQLVEMLKGTYGHDAMNCMILCVFSKGKTSFENYL